MSTEVSASITDFVSHLWGCIAPQAAYIYRFEENRDALRTKMEELKDLKKDTMERVAVAEGRRMKRLNQVEGWIQRVEKIEVEVEQLIIDASQEIQKKCLGDCCPKNCKRSYKLGKTVAKKLKDVADLKSTGNFEVVAAEQPSPLVDKRPTELTVGLKSTFDEVWSYIEDDQAEIIGIYGVGGVGKSTLMAEINNMLVDTYTTRGFDFVIWTVVSNNPNSKKIQEDIGKKIGFVDEAWKNKSQDDKTSDIWGVLRQKKFVLLLDDIWERFELLNVGVPLPDEQNKSKVVFTTRSLDVCGRMEANRKIKVKSLEWEEAWTLFQQKAGEETINSQPEIPELAKVVARECSGLPLALITIGRAMACKRTPQEWRHAIAMLKKSAAEFTGMGDEVYPRLKFSYDNLQSDIVKSCFLYCSLFPEDGEIFKSQLVYYWIGEGFLDGFDDLDEARNWGHDIIGTLIHACLLEEVSSSYGVKMHDVIRDMAQWIACECGKVKNKIFVQTRIDSTKAPEVEKWKGVERMSLMENKIVELTGTPSCPNLLTLFLNKNNLDTIARGFFQNMPKLRVLDLSDNYNLNELPVDIYELVSLQYLNLSWTKIRELPIECKKLVELKYLGLQGTRVLNIIPAGVFSSFKKLLVLDMFISGSSVRVDSGVEEAWVKELELLKELNDLRITIKNPTTFSAFLSSLKLLSCATTLSLNGLRGFKYLDISLLQSMASLKTLYIFDCVDLEDFIVERGRIGLENSEITRQLCFRTLTSVHIAKCGMLKRELTWLIFAPNLEGLFIWNCGKIEEVICGGGKLSEAIEDGGYQLNLFAKLGDLYLQDLPQLKSICPNALPFACLDRIRVYNCPNLKKLPFNSDSAKGRKLRIAGSQEWWNDLEWEDEATRNAFLSTFQRRN